MTAIQVGILLAATTLTMFTYWWQSMSAMPGLKLGQAAVNNQVSTAVANTMPVGGYVAVAVQYEMYRSWGYSGSEVGISVAVTSIWNILARLAMPALALGLVLAMGGGSRSLVPASIVGVAILAAVVVAFALVLWKERIARGVGSGLDRAASWFCRVIRRPRAFAFAEGAVRLRRDSIELIVRRWPALTATTVGSHLSLFLVLLLALRFAGVSEAQVSWAEVLGVFALGRLLTALPLTPGGIGVVELVYIGGLILAGGGHATADPALFHTQVAAGVLVFRALTYGIQIPLGGLAYVFHRANRAMTRPVPVAIPVAVRASQPDW
jgi:uncharacterized membrane protein YbhN (UPF0104 family)